MIKPKKTVNFYNDVSTGKIKVYTYTRVSTAMQVYGFSLDAQKSRMKAFTDFSGYEDAGKSGKSVEDRLEFYDNSIFYYFCLSFSFATANINLILFS
ncbi:MAG: hypothetical protein R3Y33_06375 [Clostridia bacterium]